MTLHELEQIIIARKSADPGSSWTAQLLSKGPGQMRHEIW
jgi:phosphoribosyl-ATP pyrophosphohydrolase